ncbi:MAG: MOSC domain-containing protein [Candidatus Poseidoniaceae archaeon]|nr:MOSC domain-containing protein [Candidatus Poseidoniaceae archaeon]
MSGSVLGLFASPKGGVPKFPVNDLQVSNNGCIGDRQNDLKHHGGPRRAVCLMALDVMESLQRDGHPIEGGSTGENLLIEGIAWTDFEVGTVLRTEEVVLRITGDAPPCKTIRDSFTNGTFKSLAHTILAKKTRWYAEVLQEGTLHLGEAIQIDAIS